MTVGVPVVQEDCETTATHEAGSSSSRPGSPLASTNAADVRRSIFPMRYQSSDPSTKLDDDDIFTASPQSATLFPSSSTSNLSFLLPPHPSQSLVLPKDRDGYTHSFYDLKAAATRRTDSRPAPNTTTTMQQEGPATDKPFWENLIRLLPWVRDQQDSTTTVTTTVIDTTVHLRPDEDTIPSHVTTPSANRIVSRTESNPEDTCRTTTITKHNERTAVVLPKRPSSILRQSRFSSERMAASNAEKTDETPSSMDSSDVPSLASDSDSSIASSVSSSGQQQGGLLLPISSIRLTTSCAVLPLPRPARRCNSEPCQLSRRASFDPRISVRQFNRSREELKNAWFSQDELCNFRKEALQQIIQFQRRGDLSSAGGRATFTHQALGLNNTIENGAAAAAVHQENQATIQNILIVDAHDICANLFAKGLLALFPHARIVKAPSTVEATKQMQRIRFDIILVEERLKVFHRQVEPASGSCLLKSVRHQDQTLLIGVSAHLQQDATKLQAAGADVLWSKPPPRMDENLRKTLVKKLLAKRGGGVKSATICTPPPPEWPVRGSLSS